MKRFLTIVGLLATLGAGGWALTSANAATAGETPPCYPDGPLCKPCCK